MLQPRPRPQPTPPAEADIIVAALGKPEFMTGDWIKPGAAVIDVGINAVDDPGSAKGYKLVRACVRVRLRACVRLRVCDVCVGACVCGCGWKVCVQSAEECVCVCVQV